MGSWFVIGWRWTMQLTYMRHHSLIGKRHGANAYVHCCSRWKLAFATLHLIAYCLSYFLLDSDGIALHVGKYFKIGFLGAMLIDNMWRSINVCPSPLIVHFMLQHLALRMNLQMIAANMQCRTGHKSTTNDKPALVTMNRILKQVHFHSRRYPIARLYQYGAWPKNRVCHWINFGWEEMWSGAAVFGQMEGTSYLCAWAHWICWTQPLCT